MIDERNDRGGNLPLISCSRIQMGRARGIWRVTKDGRFHGDFFKKQDALAAALTARGTTAPSLWR